MKFNVTVPSRGRGMVVFGSLFLAAGLGVLVMSPLDTLRLHVMSANWVRVPAQLREVKVVSTPAKGTHTYRVRASYQYEFGGTRYDGTRVGYETGSDGFNIYHTQLAGRLRGAMDRGRPVQAWVNPSDPQQAFLVRELRWQKLLLTSVFGLMFAGTGGLMMYFGARPAATSNLLAASGPIYSAERSSYRVWWVIGSLFVLIALPALVELPTALRSGKPALLFVLLFPLVGSVLLWIGVKGWRSWRHYGPLPVELDPQPGQVGGDIGGRIQLRSPWRADNPYRVTLQCLHSKMSGSGKNRRRSESTVWQAEQTPHLEASGTGTELRFLFQTPAGLPASEPVANEYHLWRLLLSGPQQPLPLERTYEIPVVRGSGQSRLSIPTSFHDQQAQQSKQRALASANAQIRITQARGGVQVRSPFGLHLGTKLILFVFGAAFAGMALFLYYEALKNGGMMWFMTVMFAMFGVPMLLGGIFMVGRSLDAEVRNGTLVSVRYWFGLALWRRQIPLARAEQLSLVAGVKSHDGRRQKEYFHLIAREEGRKLRVAEDIEGREAVEALRDNLIGLLGLR